MLFEQRTRPHDLRSMLTGRIPVFPRGDSCPDLDGEAIFAVGGPRSGSQEDSHSPSPTSKQRTMLSVVAGVVSDINQVDSSPTNLTDVGGKLFFVTQDSSPGTESLWATDGTAQGAVELASIDEPSYGLPSNSPPFVSRERHGLLHEHRLERRPGSVQDRRNNRRHQLRSPRFPTSATTWRPPAERSFSPRTAPPVSSSGHPTARQAGRPR